MTPSPDPFHSHPADCLCLSSKEFKRQTREDFWSHINATVGSDPSRPDFRTVCVLKAVNDRGVPVLAMVPLALPDRRAEKDLPHREAIGASKEVDWLEKLK